MRQGITTIVVTHDMNSVMEIGDYVMFMYKGRKLWEGPNTDILDADIRELQDFVYSNKLMTALKEQSSWQGSEHGHNLHPANVHNVQITGFSTFIKQIHLQAMK